MAEFNTTIIGDIAGQDEGWHYANPNQCGVTLPGNAIKGDPLAVGSEVDVVQCGNWDDYTNEFGFVPRSFGYGSVYQVPPFQRSSAIDIARASAALSALCQQAGRVEPRYIRATVVSVQPTTLTVQMRDAPITRTIPTSPDLSPGDFAVDDTVILRTTPRLECIGWWQMIPYNVRLVKTLTPGGPVVDGEVSTQLGAIKRAFQMKPTVSGIGAYTTPIIKREAYPELPITNSVRHTSLMPGVELRIYSGSGDTRYITPAAFKAGVAWCNSVGSFGSQGVSVEYVPIVGGYQYGAILVLPPAQIGTTGENLGLSIDTPHSWTWGTV